MKNTQTKIPDPRALVQSVKHWHQNFEVAPGVWTGGSYKPQFWLQWMSLPNDLRGRRVLEIGSCDGFFTVELARRGADVVAIDYQPKTQTGFWVTEAISGIKVEFHCANIYDIPALNLGTFDIVLFMGVLYHLPDPYRSLVLLADHCKEGGRLFLETVVTERLPADLPLMQFYKGRSLVNDLTNFWVATPRCVMDLVEDVGFQVRRSQVMASPGAEVTRMIAEVTRAVVNGSETERRKALAYGRWNGMAQ